VSNACSALNVGFNPVLRVVCESRRALNLTRRPGIAGLCALPDAPAVPNKLVPVRLSALVDHSFPFPLVLVFFGRPPSLPHSRIFLTNSRLPQFFWRTSALRFPRALAALLTSGLDGFFMTHNNKPNVRICQWDIRTFFFLLRVIKVEPDNC